MYFWRKKHLSRNRMCLQIFIQKFGIISTCSFVAAPRGRSLCILYKCRFAALVASSCSTVYSPAPWVNFIIILQLQIDYKLNELWSCPIQYLKLISLVQLMSKFYTCHIFAVAVCLFSHFSSVEHRPNRRKWCRLSVWTWTASKQSAQGIVGELITRWWFTDTAERGSCTVDTKLFMM